MRKIIAGNVLVLSVVIAVTSLPHAALGQGRRSAACSGGSGRISADADDRSMAGAPACRWVSPADPDDRQRVYLYRGNVQVGGWDYAAGYYRAYDAATDTWGPLQEQAPIAPPRAAAPARIPLEEWKVTGVDASRLNAAGAHAYTVNGMAVSEDNAFDQLKMEDDSGKLWFIPIGPDDVRQKVLADLASDPKLEDFRRHIRIWNVPPDHFSLCDRDTNKPMFNTTGNPSIYLLAPQGEVLYAQSGYKSGDLEDIRKSDPSYPPDKPPAQPDAKKKDQPAAPAGAVPLWAILAGGSVATLLFLSKGKKT